MCLYNLCRFDQNLNFHTPVLTNTPIATPHPSPRRTSLYFLLTFQYTQCTGLVHMSNAIHPCPRHVTTAVALQLGCVLVLYANIHFKAIALVVDFLFRVHGNVLHIVVWQAHRTEDGHSTPQSAIHNNNGCRTGYRHCNHTLCMGNLAQWRYRRVVDVVEETDRVSLLCSGLRVHLLKSGDWTCSMCTCSN